MESILPLIESLVNGQNIQSTEQKLAQYSTRSGYGMVLLQIFCNESGNNHHGNINDLIRHQTGILLKNFLSKNWENNIIDEKEKNSIKCLILNKKLFCDKNSNIRKTTGMIISVLAEYDYPEKWNNFLNIILTYIREACSNKNILLLSGTMNVLKYFVEHICDLQIPNITPILFPLLLNIICEKSIDLEIRYDALSIYHNLLNTTLEMRIINNSLIKTLINPTILKYLQFINDDILKQHDQNQNYLKLQILSISILNDITKIYSLSIIKYLPNILNTTWNLMIFYGDIYDKDNDKDNDKDEITKFFDISFDFICTILKHKRWEIRKLLDDKLNNISLLIIKLLNLCHEDVELFLNSPNEFILNEENIYCSNNLRSIIINIMIRFLEIRPRTGYYSLLQSAKNYNLNPSNDSNKTIFNHESKLLVFGYLAQCYYKSSQSLKDFKIEEFLQNILWKDIHCNQPLIQYRALWTLNKFISSLSISAKKQVLPQIVNCMKSTNPLCIRFCAIKCFESIISSCSIHSEHIENIDVILNGVLPLICHLFSKMDETTLKYLLSSLSVIIKYNKIKCAQFESNIIPLIIDLWSKYCLNQDITHYIKQIISTFVSIQLCQENVIKHIIPSVLKILNNQTKECDICVIFNSLEILHILMIHSFKNTSNNLNDINMMYYKQCLPQILDLVYNTTDCDIMNICTKILCLLINNNPDLIMNGNANGNHKSNIQYICQIISKFLSDSIPENASNGIGPLINQLIINLKCTLNDSMFTDLLLTIINKINNCFTTSLKNELLLIFPRLIHEYDHHQIILFLSKHNKLNNILTLWCSNHNDFIYPYYKKVSIIALAKLLKTNNNLINNLTFDGYPIINIHAPRSSRSRSQKLQFTQMPFIVKFFQILINTYSDLVEIINNDQLDHDEDDDEDDEEEEDEEVQEEGDDEEDEEDDDDDDEYNPDDDDEDDDEEGEESEDDEEHESDFRNDHKLLLQEQKTKTKHQLLTKRKAKSKMDGMECDEDEFELYPEAKNDKIYFMDFEKWAKDFTKQFSYENGTAFQGVISMLNDKDKNILKHILE